VTANALLADLERGLDEEERAARDELLRNAETATKIVLPPMDWTLGSGYGHRSEIALRPKAGCHRARFGQAQAADAEAFGLA
jgi:hypothetical protein